MGPGSGEDTVDRSGPGGGAGPGGSHRPAHASRGAPSWTPGRCDRCLENLQKALGGLTSPKQIICSKLADTVK